MTNTNQCKGCNQQIHDGTHLCAKCARQLKRHLTDTANHYTDLDTLRTRQRAIRYDLPRTGKGGKKEQPLPIDHRFLIPSTDDNGKYLEGWATVVTQQARASAERWTQTALRTWPHIVTKPPQNTVPGMCQFLKSITTAIAGQPWAGEMLHDLATVTRRLEHLVDIAPEKRFAGKCLIPNPDGSGHCEQELYAGPWQSVIICPACGTEHSVEERRKFLLEQVAHMNVTAQEAAEALAAWTDLAHNPGKLRDRIRKWADRGRLETVGTIIDRGKPRRLYRMADIQELLIASAQHTHTN